MGAEKCSAGKVLPLQVWEPEFECPAQSKSVGCANIHLSQPWRGHRQTPGAGCQSTKPMKTVPKE